MAHAQPSSPAFRQHASSLSEQRSPSHKETRSLARILRCLAQDAARSKPSIIIPDIRSAQQLLCAHCTSIAPDDWHLTLRWTLTHLARHTAPLKQYEATVIANPVIDAYTSTNTNTNTNKTVNPQAQCAPSLTPTALHNFALGVLAHLDRLTPERD